MKILQKPRPSSIASAMLLIVVLFGLCGAFFSNVTGIPKLHYTPVLAAVILAFLSSLSKKATHIYVILLLILFAAPAFAASGYGFLSYSSTMLLPFIWFIAGQRFKLVNIKIGLYTIGCFLLLGLAIERSNVAQGLFTFIGYVVGEEVGQRYGSFTLNPLALGYFSAVVGTIALGEERKKVRLIVLGCIAVLLFAANSRGAIITFIAGLATYLFLNRDTSKAPQKRFTTLALAVMSAMIIAAPALMITAPRALSTFDWTNDRGNIGRVIQWTHCINLTIENPLTGAGAGAMSPIGFGDDIEIEQGILRSCESGFLKIFAEYGAPIGTLYLFSLITITFKAIKNRKYPKNSNTSQTQYNAVVAACTALLLQQILNQTLESIWIGAVFFGLLGYANGQLRVISRWRKT